MVSGMGSVFGLSELIMKKISDVENGRIKTEAYRSAVVLSNGNIDNQGYLIRHIELREYIENFDPKRGRYCLVTVLVQTDNEIIEMKYDEGYIDDLGFELLVTSLTKYTGLSALINRALLELKSQR
jgi:hypothetical protein